MRYVFINRKVVKLKVADKRRGRLGRKYGLLWKKSSVDSFSIPILVQKIMTQCSASAGEAEQNPFGPMRRVLPTLTYLIDEYIN